MLRCAGGGWIERLAGPEAGSAPRAKPLSRWPRSAGGLGGADPAADRVLRGASMAKKGSSSPTKDKTEAAKPKVGADTPGQPSAASKRRASKSEPIPLKWKVVGISDELALTLLKSVDKSVAESELSRLKVESRYDNLAIYPIDEVIPSPNPAKKEREHARVHEKAAKAAGKAPKRTPRQAKVAVKGKKATAKGAKPAGKEAKTPKTPVPKPKPKAKTAPKGTKKAAAKPKGKRSAKVPSRPATRKKAKSPAKRKATRKTAKAKKPTRAKKRK